MSDVHDAIDALEGLAERTTDLATQREAWAEADRLRERLMAREPYVPDSPGVSRPRHMDDEDWAEYRMTAEYAYEVSYQPDYDPYE